MTQSGYCSRAVLLLSFFLPLGFAVPFPFPNNTVTATSVSTSGGFPTLTLAANTTSPTTAAQNATSALNPDATDCQLALPANALTAEGLSTPWILLPPCSQTQAGQQSFAEAAVIDANGQISIYHPLIIDQGKTPAVAPVVPNLGPGAQVALFFGFNGNSLTLVDSNGKDTNNSPDLANMKCVNGLPGVQGDLFGQVSWCNTDAFWNAANAGIASGKTVVSPLGQNSKGGDCLSSRSFQVIDQDQSDNLPTQYLLMPDGSTMQFTAATKAKFPEATVIDNASDEALIDLILDPVIGCTTFKVPSLDDPGAMVGSLATQELQASVFQKEPIALVPLNDPDTVLTSDGSQSTDKTNAYRIGVNMPLLGTGGNTDDGSGATYCNNMINVQAPFLAQFQTELTAAGTPDNAVGNNLFTFLANRYLQSIVNLGCKNTNIPITCVLDGNQVATSCTISATGTGSGTGTGGTGTGGTGTGGTGTGGTGTGGTGTGGTGTGGTGTGGTGTGGTGTGGTGTGGTGTGGTGTGGTGTVSSSSISMPGMPPPSNTPPAPPTQSNPFSQPTPPSNPTSASTPPQGGFTPPGMPQPTPPPSQSQPSLATAPGSPATVPPPPPIQSFQPIATSSMSTSAAAAACTQALANQNCWEAFGWQLCRVGNMNAGDGHGGFDVEAVEFEGGYGY